MFQIETTVFALCGKGLLLRCDLVQVNMGYELIRKGSGMDYEYSYLKLMAEKERYFSNPWLKESCCQSKQTRTKEDPLEVNYKPFFYYFLCYYISCTIDITSS